MAPKSSSSNALLSAYVEPLAVSRRVAVVGVSAAELGERLLDLGARSVHAYELGPLFTAPAAAPRVIHKRLPDVREQDFDARDGAFDLVVIPDASALRHVSVLLERVRRLVGEAGVVVAAAAAEGPLGYYELYDAVALQFAEIAMVGEVPFRGAALAVLGEEGDPEVTVDTQLATEPPPPERFIAVASQAPLDLRPYVIVQLPAPDSASSDAVLTPRLPAPPSSSHLPVTPSDSGLMTTPAPPPRSATSLEDVEARERDRAALAEARLRVGVLETQLEEERSRALAAAERVRHIENERTRREGATAEVVEALRVSEAARALAVARLAEIERVLLTREEHLASAIARVGELEAVVLRASELEASAVRTEQAQMAARALEAELLEIAEGNAAEVAALEDALRERGRVIHGLERELVRRERMVKELLTASVEHGAPISSAPIAAPVVHAPPASTKATKAAGSPELERAHEAAKVEVERLRGVEARLRAQLESISVDAARREGEIQAMRWRIEELELGRDVDGTRAAPATVETSPSAPATTSDDEVGRLKDELDALRQALRQEHDARVRAEKRDRGGVESGSGDATTG